MSVTNKGNDMLDFSNQVAVISGAASGIGFLTAQRLAAKGANVVLTDVNFEAVQAAAAEITKLGGSSLALHVDVRDYNMIKGAIEQAFARFGHIDILVNNAGGASVRVFERKEDFKDLPIEIVDWGIDVNLKGPVYFAHAVIGHMIKQKKGVIINIGSIDGETGSLAVDYSTAKSGVMYGLTKSLALYGGPYGVRACCVSPGPVLTRPAMANMKTLLGRAAQPEEIVDLIEYLCSDRAAFITGSNYLIDGGRSCGAKE